MDITTGKVTRRQKAVFVALKHELSHLKEVGASDVHYAIEQDRSDKVFHLTGIQMGDISVSSVKDTLEQLPVPRRRISQKFGTVYTNPFYEEPKTYQVIVMEYGERLPADVGAFAHPSADGSTCAVCVREVVKFSSEEAALEFGIEAESDHNVHKAVVELV